jgi:hypothetical protein
MAKKEFTPEIIAKIEEYALNLCTNKTIAVALGINPHTFNKHFGDICEQKRAMARVELHELQKKRAQANDTTMLVWLGKNELGQTDKFESKNSSITAVKIASPQEEREKLEKRSQRLGRKGLSLNSVYSDN